FGGGFLFLILVSSAMNGISFLTPLWLVCLGFFPGLLRKAPPQGRSAPQRLLQRYLVILLLGLVLGVLVLGVGQIKERWLIPSLFLVPLFFFSGADQEPLSPLRARWYRRLALAAAGVTLLAAGSRVVLGPRLGVTTRVNYPFSEVARAFSERGVEGATIVSHNAWFAGNLLVRLPGIQAYVPGFVLPAPPPDRPVFAVWDAVRSEQIPAEIREDLSSRFGLSTEDLVPEYRVFPYRFGAGREARIGSVRLGDRPPQTWP
ncbi:hypothetical protein ACFL3S_12885, partial [Gemmatimonadota bacterium]